MRTFRRIDTARQGDAGSSHPSALAPFTALLSRRSERSSLLLARSRRARTLKLSASPGSSSTAGSCASKTGPLNSKARSWSVWSPVLVRSVQLSTDSPGATTPKSMTQSVASPWHANPKSSLGGQRHPSARTARSAGARLPSWHITAADHSNRKDHRMSHPLTLLGRDPSNKWHLSAGQRTLSTMNAKPADLSKTIAEQNAALAAAMGDPGSKPAWRGLSHRYAGYLSLLFTVACCGAPSRV